MWTALAFSFKIKMMNFRRPGPLTFCLLFPLILSPQAFGGEARFTALQAYDYALDNDGTDTAVVNVLDPAVLDLLEKSGFSFSEMIGGSQAFENTQKTYAGNPFFRQIADLVGQKLAHDAKTDQLPAVIPPGHGDIPEMVRLLRQFEDKGKRSDKDQKGGYFIRHLSNNSSYPYLVEADGDEPRHFDQRWLNSPLSQMKLVAVANRLDRMDFDSKSCGEVRFIYRLAYSAAKSNSTLPFFASVVQRYPYRESCQLYAQRWMISDKLSKALVRAEGQGAAQYRDWLQTNPLKDLFFKQVELNYQALRFTSGYMQDFGGQAMYLQRVLRLQAGQLVPTKLENTPDVQALEKSTALMKSFVEQLKKPENLLRLDQGILQLEFDPNFLTETSVSWSTLGRVRLANKPYQTLFEKRPELLNDIDYTKLKFIKSRQAFLERLDNLTCMGCHQSGGTAGFHVMGQAHPKFSHSFNQQQLALSPHAYADHFRRQAFVQKVAKGEQPDRFRPLSQFSEAQWTVKGREYQNLTRGQLCLLDSAGHFSESPRCEEGTECRATVTRADGPVLWGECTLKMTKNALENRAGVACWQGEISEKQKAPADRGRLPSYNFFAFQDKWKLKGPIRSAAASALKPYKCVLPQSGAPLGRMSRPCTLAEENFEDQAGLSAQKLPVEICANQGGNGFDACAATGDGGACLQSRVVRSMLDTCYPGRFCREDYICQKLPQYDQISKADYASVKNGKKVNASTPDKISSKNLSALHTQQIGFCVPTYFLFNMRVDGHPSPVTGMAPGVPVVDSKKPLRGY